MVTEPSKDVLVSVVNRGIIRGPTTKYHIANANSQRRNRMRSATRNDKVTNIQTRNGMSNNHISVVGSPAQYAHKLEGLEANQAYFI